MTVKNNRLAAITFVFALTSSIFVYSQNDFILTDGATMTFAEKQRESLQRAKECIGVENIHVLQTKNYDITKKWENSEISDGSRIFSALLNQETGIYTLISQPTPWLGVSKKEKKTKEYKEKIEAKRAIFEKMLPCLSAANIYVIETKDAELLSTWIKAEDESRDITTHFDAETGIYTAISTPKTDGHGKVMFRKVD